MLWPLLIQSPAALQVIVHKQRLGEEHSGIKPHSPICGSNGIRESAVGNLKKHTTL